MGQQISLQGVRDRYHTDYLEARRLSRLVNSPRFAQAYAIRQDVDHNNLDAWIEEVLSQDLEEMSVRQLRDIARKFGVVKYTMYNRINLIMKVRNVIEASKPTSSVSHQEVRSSA